MGGQLLEKHIQKAIIDFLSILQMKRAISFYRIANGPMVFGSGSKKCFAKNPSPGIPDIVILLPEGKTIWCEVKSENGRQGPDQKIFEENCNAFGHTYILVRSLEQLRDHLIVRGITV